MNTIQPNTLYPTWFKTTPKTPLPSSKLQIVGNRAISPGSTAITIYHNPLHSPNSVPKRRATPCLRVTLDGKIRTASLPTIKETSRATTPVTSQRELQEVFVFDWEADTSQPTSHNEIDNDFLNRCPSNVDTDSDSDIGPFIRRSPSGEWVDDYR